MSAPRALPVDPPDSEPRRVPRAGRRVRRLLRPTTPERRHRTALLVAAVCASVALKNRVAFLNTY